MIITTKAGVAHYTELPSGAISVDENSEIDFGITEAGTMNGDIGEVKISMAAQGVENFVEGNMALLQQYFSKEER